MPSRQYLEINLHEIQRTTCIGASGALHSYLVNALYVRLLVLPLDLFMEAKSYCYSNILNNVPKLILFQWSTPHKLKVKRNSAVGFLPRWKGRSTTYCRVTESYFLPTSKMVYGIAASVYSDAHNVVAWYGIPVCIPNW